MKHFKFNHYLLIDKTINILAKNETEAYLVLHKHYKNSSDYEIDY